MKPPAQLISQDEAKRLRQENDDLRTVLRSLISCGSTSATIKAMAMNTLEAGSGDAWLTTQRQGLGLEGEKTHE